VHFLGARKPGDLGAYQQHFDVCLMCYEVNEYTRYIYPLKLHEYLASGRPAISAPIDAVLPHEGFVRLASGTQQWLAAIDESLSGAAQAADQSRARQAHALEHDWNALVEKIAALFEEGLSRN
jgi:glycosyltransferase involved in cell wall biosynthesis